MGIDYGRCITNIDFTTNIRYGVIPVNKVDYIWEDLEPVYPDVICSFCKTKNNYNQIGYETAECLSCSSVFDNVEDLEPIGWSFKDDRYELSLDEYGDLWIFKSPYYAMAGFCSPCAPGAVYLTDRNEDAPGYCLGPEFFEDGNIPYKVFEVKSIFEEERDGETQADQGA